MVSTTAAPTLPSLARVGLARGRMELRQFFREREAVVFTLMFPVLLLVIFGAVLNNRVAGTNIDFHTAFVPGMIASGIMATSFQSLAISIAIERDDGTLKRLRGLPMPTAAYFLGKIILVLVTSLLEVTILLAIGVAFFGVELPSTVDKWATFGWVFLLGVAACSTLGIVVSTIPKSGRSASAVVTLPFVILQFISGVYFMTSDLPGWLQHVGALFPLKWMCQGLRSVFLPDSWLSQEVTHSWETGRTALVLVLWLAGGLLLALRTFRWTSRADG